MEKEQFLRIVAENVRTHMNKANLSNSDLARVSKISTGTVSKILKGSMSISLSLAMTLADGLGINVSDLLEGAVEKKEINKAKKLPINTKGQPSAIGILSINNRRITCIKDYSGQVIGASELEGGLDLAETSNSLLNLIRESIFAALPSGENAHEQLNEKLKNAQLNVVTQSYEFEESREKFANFVRRYFKDVHLLSDWQIVYLSAFKDKPGISLIVDKGISLAYMNKGKLRKLGGWKFPVYDLGGENWLGMEVIRHTIDAVEGYIPMTDLAQNIMVKYNGKIERITEACFKGMKNHDIYCTFCDPLFRAYLVKDETAVAMIQNGFNQIKRLIDRVDEIIGQPLKISLTGSMEKIYKPFLDSSRLINSSTQPDKASLLADVTKEQLANYGITHEQYEPALRANSQDNDS